MLQSTAGMPSDFKLSILQLKIGKTSHTMIERFGTSDVIDTYDALQITPDFTPDIWSICWYLYCTYVEFPDSS